MFLYYSWNIFCCFFYLIIKFNKIILCFCIIFLFVIFFYNKFLTWFSKLPPFKKVRFYFSITTESSFGYCFVYFEEPFYVEFFFFKETLYWLTFFFIIVKLLLKYPFVTLKYPFVTLVIKNSIQIRIFFNLTYKILLRRFLLLQTRFNLYRV